MLTLQPVPIKAMYTRTTLEGGWPATNVARLFRTSDIPLCRLCRECTADRATGMCINTYPVDIPVNDIKMFKMD